jgi:hypothetical protein
VLRAEIACFRACKSSRPSRKNAAEIASSREKHGKNQRKWANFQENPKKPVEIGCFSIDFNHLEAAL